MTCPYCGNKLDKCIYTDEALECKNIEEKIMKKPPEFLRAAAQIYEERNKLYGDNYKRFGPIMHLLFPDGLPLHGAKEHNRFGILVQIVAKITRYAENFERGGHDDSLDDMAVYAMMLKELDIEARQNEEKA